jgi:2-haloacid dehalogenase
MNKIIVFDIGGVLIDWNPRYAYSKIFEDKQKMEWFLTEICSPEWNGKQDAGRTFAEGTAELTAKYPQYKKEIEFFYDNWTNMFGGAIQGSVDILKQLKAQGYTLYCITNWSAEGFPWARQHFPFLNLFEDIVVSGEVKMLKPDPKIFNLLLQRHNIKAEDCVFIDDNKDNITTASALGFNTVHFKDPQQLKAALAAFGVSLCGECVTTK